VILEERRSRVENVPSSILSEMMSAALYQNHPYRIPVIGWMHEMQKLSRADALAFYKRYYAPNNAIVVVSGDVTEAEVRALAEEAYGKIPANPDIKPRMRPQEPPQRGPRRVELRDPRAGVASVRRYYLAPSIKGAEPGEAEALYLLLKIAGHGPTSRLYQKLVVEEKVASSAGGWYSALSLDSGTIGLYAVAADGVPLEKVEAEMDSVMQELRKAPVSQSELDRAKKIYLADWIYESDNQSALARRYGTGLVLGQTIDEINRWPDTVAKVTVQDVQQAAAKHLDNRQSVTGYLIPTAPDPETTSARKPAAGNRS
jgi:zinc protease